MGLRRMNFSSAFGKTNSWESSLDWSEKWMNDVHMLVRDELPGNVTFAIKYSHACLIEVGSWMKSQI